ncbi:DUF1501 domain-containing protein [Candidatus Kapabacteria bacterium]|nr:DUF1501 domain-containing protein [Candidatus Kapabacteria bacterium]
MKRREFIQKTGIAASIPFLINGMKVSAEATPFFQDLANAGEAEDRILVLVQLIGGNDGLNTIIPIDQYSQLSSLRNSVFIPENKLLDFDNNLKLHPSLGGFQKLWQEGKFETILNVAYPDQNLSHFRSTDIWTSASDTKDFVPSGWLGRYLDSKHPNYPDNYPNVDNPDPISLTIGNVVSQTCQGPVYTMGMAANNIDNIYKLEGSSLESEKDEYAFSELDYINRVKKQTSDYLDVIEIAANQGRINDSIWASNDDGNSLANQLKVVARLINGGLKTKVYVCSIANFDTHSNQIDSNDETSGQHAQLLRYLSDSITSFQDQLKEYGVEDKVLGMTFSEFGRRIMSNNSRGTDHGSAAPQFLFGTAVNPTVHGFYEEFNSDIQQNDNLDMQHDFRSVYTSILKDWFRVPENDIFNIMLKNFDTIQILKGEFTSVESLQFENSLLKCYPNPASNNSTLEFYTVTSHVEIAIYDLRGNKLQSIIDKLMPEGNYKIKLSELSNYNSGIYIISFKNRIGKKSLNLSIQK